MTNLPPLIPGGSFLTNEAGGIESMMSTGGEHYVAGTAAGVSARIHYWVQNLGHYNLALRYAT